MGDSYDLDGPGDALAFTIDMELSRQKLPARCSKNEALESNLNRRRFIARGIVQAIERSNWRFEKGPVARGHFTSWKNTGDV